MSKKYTVDMTKGNILQLIVAFAIPIMISGDIEIGTLYKHQEGTCELEVVMDPSAGNEYAFAKLDAEFLWSAE